MFSKPMPSEQDLSLQNKQAWDALYGSTQELVWGDDPVGFIQDFASDISAKLSSEARILDAGTGEGRNLPMLMNFPGQVYACDSSKNGISKLSGTLQKQVKSFLCDLDATPFEENFFDFVLLSDVVETLPDPKSVLVELHRVMKPGGCLLCNIPGFEDGIAEIDMDMIGDNQYLYQGRYFYRFVTVEQAIALLEDSGFQVLRHQLCTWVEDAHPAFRQEPHSHSSYVFFIEKPVLDPA